MTVQTPPEPGHHPSAPPWAVPPEPAHHPSPPPWNAPPEPDPSHTVPLYGGTVAPYGSPENRHGQLLVRFPAAVHGLTRPQAPSWRPVVAWTFLTGALGMIPALRRASQAHGYGRPRRPYWIAFLVTLVAGGVFWPAVAFNGVLPLYHRYQESGLTDRLQTSLVSDSRVTARFGAVSAVECTPSSDRGTDGVRGYLCTFELSTGRTNGMYVDADTEGNWRERR
jgi:hypothetical protein